MANTLNGLNIDRIAELTLDALLTELFPISAFATDFSDEVLAAGQSITTRIPVQPSIQDMSASKTPGNNQTNAVKIDLNKFKGVVLGFTDLERTYTDHDLINIFIKPAVITIFEDVLASAFALVLNANYPTNRVYASSAFDADAAATVAGDLDTNKVPGSNRSLIIPPSYNTNLAKDNSIQAAYAYGGSEAIRNNNIPVIHGMRVIKTAATIPTNSENLGAMALHPSALAIAARGVALPEAWYGEARNVTDPTTGLTIQIRKYYNGTQLVWEVALLYGVKQAQANALVRIKTA